jgi:hypothetical protein
MNDILSRKEINEQYKQRQVIGGVLAKIRPILNLNRISRR